MRKADYATLARLIRDQLATARDQKDAARQNLPGASAQWTRGDELETRATLLAREFASSASVDKAAFLKACGVD